MEHRIYDLDRAGAGWPECRQSRLGGSWEHVFLDRSGERRCRRDPDATSTFRRLESPGCARPFREGGLCCAFLVRPKQIRCNEASIQHQTSETPWISGLYPSGRRNNPVIRLGISFPAVARCDPIENLVRSCAYGETGTVETMHQQATKALAMVGSAKWIEIASFARHARRSGSLPNHLLRHSDRAKCPELHKNPRPPAATVDSVWAQKLLDSLELSG